jgi:hypothetical protein
MVDFTTNHWDFLMINGLVQGRLSAKPWSSPSNFWGFPMVSLQFFLEKHIDSDKIFPQTNLNPNTGEKTRAFSKTHS